MKLQLKVLFTHLGGELEEFVPETPENFNVHVSLTIGPDGQEGGHDYHFNVCSPRWLDHAIQHEGKVWGRHLLIVNEFEADVIKLAIDEMIKACERPTWEESSVVLGRFFAWEFEDYKPFEGE